VRYTGYTFPTKEKPFKRKAFQKKSLSKEKPFKRKAFQKKSVETFKTLNNQLLYGPRVANKP
jgi:hypothetical protein